MKKALTIMCASLLSLGVVSMVGCNSTSGTGNETADVVAKASKMSLKELEEAAKAEMEASNDTFKVVGLTSTLARGLKKFCEIYTWLPAEKTYCNNGYKDYQLLTALDQAEQTYFADFALVQDARSLADYAESGILHNYVPSDYAEMGLAEKDTLPLKGIHFNKIFFVNKTLGVDLHNIWQLAGRDTDEGHLDNLSFQSPVTEQINMSFLLSLYDEANAPKLAAAYKKYYGKDFATSDWKDKDGKELYTSIGDCYVTTFINNISVFHSSDGTAMKETQCKEVKVEGKDPFVYYGAFAKMKDAAGKTYDLDGDGTKETNAMTTVGWDLAIEGFNGFMYTMYSQIVNNAKHPYTACLYARFILTPEFYTSVMYSDSTPNKAGQAANMYGYYYPCTSTTVGVNDNDWTKETWMQKSIIEDYNYLKTVKTAQITKIQSLIVSKK
ncbi:MAG: hypothetical protein SPI36_04630 [Candidatus Onthovivens sp.]|nr:hypothetical protein [Mollicutes bacterium]MCI7225453.1 hypothetical protein [Mollicutes bacterium]MCI7267675.1 hypothetical protein [Mollicutes bacterium]MDY4823262.1 hypothetical protein [Candidatus Onthovivens sp.]MDY6058510.1 hypothetical protein [Candidatus Onthovivens sp.]